MMKLRPNLVLENTRFVCVCCVLFSLSFTDSVYWGFSFLFISFSLISFIISVYKSERE